MGRVYRAWDTTLGREVALKILPDLWLANPDRRARFEREARVLASLNHPNIGSIYAVQESERSPGTGPVKALVLELVEGETLADLIARHAQPSPSRSRLPIDDVVSLASQVIEALEAAHERGIVHRDLKPANVKVTPDGRVKVLDFGLARAMGSTGSGPQIADSPAITVGGPEDGVLLGTAPYMSPEQARGRIVDKRTDIWAFGCVLYEMLAGAPAFAGDGVAEVLANVIKTEPDWSALPADTPATLRLCLERCLQKDPRQRFHDIADVRLAMEGAFEHANRDSHPTRRGEGTHGRLAYAGWAVALAATAAAFAVGSRRPAEAPEIRLEVVTPPAADPLSLAISPDGRSVVYQAGQDPPRLWLRRLDQQEARPLAGTDVAPVLVTQQRVRGVHRGSRVEADRSRQWPRARARQSALRRGHVERRWNDPHGQRHRPALSCPGRRRHHREGSDQPAARADESPMAPVPAGWPALPVLHPGTTGTPWCLPRIHRRCERATNLG
jgi:hypothetical protein